MKEIVEAKRLHLVLTSDLHGYLPSIPPCDLFLIAGDLLPARLTIKEQKAWSEEYLGPWFRSVPAESTVWIGGNHDTFVLESDFAPKNFPHYLQESKINLFGLNIYGFPWVAQKRDGSFWREEAEMQKRIDEIPPCDILLSHAPPFSILDCYTAGETPELCGLPGLLEKTQDKVELFTLSGHVHEGFGLWPEVKPRVINASYVDQAYQARGKMFSLLLEKREEAYQVFSLEEINVPSPPLPT